MPAARDRTYKAVDSEQPDSDSRRVRVSVRIGGMIHVRVVSPPDVTPQLRVLLVSDTGVMNLTVVEGAMQKPDGDAIQFDVLRAGPTT